MPLVLGAAACLAGARWAVGGAGDGVGPGAPGSGGVISLHVVANSDSAPDQELKLRVRDAILAELGPRLAAARSAGEARRALEEASPAVVAAARSALRGAGRDYPVRVAFLPAGGEREAFKVIIGAGAGHNWWCVAFPPTCLGAARVGGQGASARAGAWDGAVTAFRWRDDGDGAVRIRWALAEWLSRWRGRAQFVRHDRIS